MNHEPISQLCFAQGFEVEPSHTARSLFAGLPFGERYAAHLAEVLSTAQLLAQLESLCMDALHAHIDWPREKLLGTAMRLDHCGAAAVGERVAVDGFVTGLGDRSVQFHVQARVAERLLAQGTLTFTVVAAAWRPPVQRPAYRAALT